MTKTIIKTLSNSNLCPDAVSILADCIRTTDGGLAYRKHGTSSMDGPLHLVTLAMGVIQIAVPLDAAFVEFRVKHRGIEECIHCHLFDDLLLRQGGYQRDGDTVIVVCLNGMVVELLNRMAKVMQGKRP